MNFAGTARKSSRVLQAASRTRGQAQELVTLRPVYSVALGRAAGSTARQPRFGTHRHDCVLHAVCEIFAYHMWYGLRSLYGDSGVITLKLKSRSGQIMYMLSRRSGS